jgi:hypothetical protein
VIARIVAEPERWRSRVRHDGSARRLERLWRADHDVTRGAFALGKREELRPVEVTA